jgi:hypothetical protein
LNRSPEASSQKPPTTTTPWSAASRAQKRDRLAVGLLGAGFGLCPALEDVATGDQLGQDDDGGTLRGGARHGGGGEIMVRRRIPSAGATWQHATTVTSGASISITTHHFPRSTAGTRLDGNDG